MNGNPLPPKKEVALALLERGSVHVHLDPRAGGVVVPAWFKRQPQLVLQVGLNMRPIPIPDLRVDDNGMSCTLSFNRSPFFCIVPWSSVYAMVGDDGRGMIWPEDVPPEVALQGKTRDADAPAKKPPERALAVVKSPPEPAPKAKRPSRASRVAAPDDGGGAKEGAAKEKKARAKKRPAGGPKVVENPSATDRRSEPGVLIPIPVAPTKPAQRPAARPAPAAAPAPARRPAPAASAVRPPTAVPAPPDPAPTAPQRPSSQPLQPGTKPGGGKPKREIPPYLRVVK